VRFAESRGYPADGNTGKLKSVVYAKQGPEFSVYLRVTGEQPGTESGSSDKLQLASSPLGGLKTVMVQAVIVTDAARDECARFAREAEAAL
jgi:hypothetical protein